MELAAFDEETHLGSNENSEAGAKSHVGVASSATDEISTIFEQAKPVPAITEYEREQQAASRSDPDLPARGACARDPRDPGWLLPAAKIAQAQRGDGELISKRLSRRSIERRMRFR
jgi:hypothetical protein